MKNSKDRLHMCGERAKLVLNDGTEFIGYCFGAKLSVSGEVVFNTGMIGYPESLTDPSYKGQILVLTYPLVGNYGVPPHKLNKYGLYHYFESDKIQISGLIIQDYSHEYHHWTASKSLSKWLKEHNIPGVYGIDTRELTKRLRHKGVMLGKIIVEKDVPFVDPNTRNLVAEVSIKEPIKYGNGKVRIVLIDCGVKNNIIMNLLRTDTTVIRVPWDYDFHNINFDGLMISNGPGDPKMCKETIKQVRRAIDRKIPTFGICLGNQILALAAGADTYKLKFGHRSQNQPCIDRFTGRCFITSQNHGFAVDTSSLKKGWSEWFYNANDNTNEGIIHESGLFRTIQMHPEATPGPNDLQFLFDEFIESLK